MLFKEIIPIYIENNTTPINQNTYFLIVKAGGTYSFHWVNDQFQFFLVKNFLCMEIILI
jgi:hypothetical protein